MFPPNSVINKKVSLIIDECMKKMKKHEKLVGLIADNLLTADNLSIYTTDYQELNPNKTFKS
jgi:hypothetical protein